MNHTHEHERKTCEEACEILQDVLTGSIRSQILDDVQGSGSFKESFGRLRAGMSANIFNTASGKLSLAKLVQDLDQRTRKDGFHVFHAWHHTEHRFTRENIPVLTLDLFLNTGIVPGNQRASLSILLDYYFLHVLALCAMRAWDQDDPNTNLERVTELVAALQGVQGSGHHFVERSETLLIHAISQFHPQDEAYESMISRLPTLDDSRQLYFARLSTAVLAGHLRWGFSVMYRRDLGRMRDDNFGDYPWLIAALNILMRGYVSLQNVQGDASGREVIVEAICNGLTPDPWAFFGKPPSLLSSYHAEHAEFSKLFFSHNQILMDEFVRHQPTKDSFSPLSFHFSFPHNVMVALVMVALQDGLPSEIALDAFLTSGSARDGDGSSCSVLAQRLMDYSASSSAGLKDHGAPLVVHDPMAGLRHYNMTISVITKFFSDDGK